MKKGGKTKNPRQGADPLPDPAPIEPEPRAVKRALNHAVKTLSSPEYQEQLTKLAQASIMNSLQSFQRMSELSGRLSKLDSDSMTDILEGSIDEFTRAFLQFNSDQLILLQRLSARTLEILDEESRKK